MLLLLRWLGSTAVIIDNPARTATRSASPTSLPASCSIAADRGLIAFIHTEIDPRFEGHGLASQLIAAVLDEARAAGVSVLPFCPFVNGFISRHP